MNMKFISLTINAVLKFFDYTENDNKHNTDEIVYVQKHKNRI